MRHIKGENKSPRFPVLDIQAGHSVLYAPLRRLFARPIVIWTKPIVGQGLIKP